MVGCLLTGLANNRRSLKLAKKRDTSRYTLQDGPKIVYIGVTDAPERRETEHRQDKKFDQLKIKGPKVSRDTAFDWEQEALDRYRKGHGGKPPKYND